MANKVVSFRIDNALYLQIDKVKQTTGASYADLIKRGADICIQEIQSKLDEINRLSAKASHLRELIDKREEELEQSFEQQTAERQAELDRDFQHKKAMQEDELEEARSKLVNVMEKVKSWQSELVKLQKETETQRAERDKVTKQLFKYQQKHNENQMQMYTMVLAMMDVANDMMPTLSKARDITSQNNKSDDTQQSQSINSNNVEKPLSNTATVTSMITSLMPLFSLFMVMSMMAAVTRPPKKKPPTPDTEVRPSALKDLVKRWEEHRKEAEAESSKSEPELPDEQEASDDEEEEEEEDTSEGEELEEEEEE